MLLKVVALLSLAALIGAAPAKDDMMAAEGRHVQAYAPAPAYGHAPAYAPAPAPKYGSATVTSYNRRGSYAQASDYAKPNIYGSSYGAAHPVAAPPHSPVSAYPSQAYSAPAPAYSGYGPQTNAYSAHSQQLSHDPEYDAAKDPVSQYAAYVPVREYAGKAHSNGNELSIYGYRK